MSAQITTHQIRKRQ